MKNVYKSIGILTVLACLLGAPAWSQSGPEELVRSTSSYVLKQVQTRRAALKKDSGPIYALVKAEVIPHFDFLVMSRGALGRNWKKANDEQRHKLANEFQEMLVRTYALALLNYSGQDIEYMPFRGKAGDRKVTVSTKVREKGGPAVPINYRLYDKDGQWLIYDVVIDGISLVSNYRSSFKNEVRRNGIDGLIETLAKRNQKMRAQG